jgi:hypothetical protein
MGLNSTALMLPGQWQEEQLRIASAGFMLPVGTAWVERDVLGIADEINARWPNLRVASCACGHCVERGHAPHAVLEYCRDGVTRPVFTFVQFNRDVIDRLHQIHVSNDPAAQHAAHNAALRKELKAKSDAVLDEGLEIVEAALRSPKQDWRGPNGMRTDSSISASRVVA